MNFICDMLPWWRRQNISSHVQIIMILFCKVFLRFIDYTTTWLACISVIARIFGICLEHNSKIEVIKRANALLHKLNVRLYNLLSQTHGLLGVNWFKHSMLLLIYFETFSKFTEAVCQKRRLIRVLRYERALQGIFILTRSTQTSLNSQIFIFAGIVVWVQIGKLYVSLYLSFVAHGPMRSCKIDYHSKILFFNIT